MSTLIFSFWCQVCDCNCVCICWLLPGFAVLDVDTTGLIIATSLDSRPARPLSRCTNRQGTKRIGEAESLADTKKIMKQERQKERRGRQGAQSAAVLEEGCHHYANLMQISHFQLIGNGTLHQGRDNMMESNKLNT